jgi:hypothetical protein
VKRIGAVTLALFLLWLFFRPRSVPCPQCRGKGAPPVYHAGQARARICATCGVSATPDLPLMGEVPVEDEPTPLGWQDP